MFNGLVVVNWPCSSGGARLDRFHRNIHELLEIVAILLKDVDPGIGKPFQQFHSQERMVDMFAFAGPSGLGRVRSRLNRSPTVVPVEDPYNTWKCCDTSGTHSLRYSKALLILVNC